MLKVQLSRNLRRTILRGHPWIYQDALKSRPKVKTSQLCQVLDMKGEFLGWAMLDPHGPLALRILSLKKTPPDNHHYRSLFENALRIRTSVVPPETDCFRLFNGEGDLLPGLVCDVYGWVAVLQFDGQGPEEFWDKQFIADWLVKSTSCKTAIHKTRRSSSERGISVLAGEPCGNEVVCRENGVAFKVELEKGQKTGFFLDQRDNRNYVRQTSRGKSLLNLFSYSGGFSIYAGRGGAKKVVSVDVAQGAIDLAEENWALNELPREQHHGICADVFEYLQNENERWDAIIVDPPSMSHSEDQKRKAVEKYIDLFAVSTKKVRSGGDLFVSSCSSHISFDDFFEIINESLSQSRRRGQILRVSGQGPDHPFPHASHELRYLKFVHLILD